mmetsp:Transcript_13074/g.40271  ORF Transcript_13074/g.40271 Transcript_13074/m.40271 type:complete len:96 (-) Transcript_13074:713-1000(-)
MSSRQQSEERQTCGCTAGMSELYTCVDASLAERSDGGGSAWLQGIYFAIASSRMQVFPHMLRVCHSGRENVRSVKRSRTHSVEADEVQPSGRIRI